jgi:hypothetical protein
VLEIFLEIILAIAGAVFFGSAAVALGAVAIGCIVCGGCWSFLGWRKRRAARLRDRA